MPAKPLTPDQAREILADYQRKDAAVEAYRAKMRREHPRLSLVKREQLVMDHFNPEHWPASLYRIGSLTKRFGPGLQRIIDGEPDSIG